MHKSINFNFNLPDLIERVEIDKINENFEIIDNNLLPKESGKGYSSNDFTNDYRNKIDQVDSQLENIIGDLNINFNQSNSNLVVSVYNNNEFQKYFILSGGSEISTKYYTKPSNLSVSSQNNLYTIIAGFTIEDPTKVRIENGKIYFIDTEQQVTHEYNLDDITSWEDATDLYNLLLQFKTEESIRSVNFGNIYPLMYNNILKDSLTSNNENIDYESMNFFILYENDYSTQESVSYPRARLITSNTISKAEIEKELLFSRSTIIPLTTIIKSAEYDQTTNSFIFVLLDDSIVTLPVSSLVDGLVPIDRKIANIQLNADISKNDLKINLDITSIETKLNKLTTDVQEIKSVQSLPSLPLSSTLYLIPEEV